MACDWSTATDPPFLLVVVEIDTLFSKLDNYYPLPLAPATHHSNNCQLLHKPFKNNSFLNDICKKKVGKVDYMLIQIVLKAEK